MGGVGVNGIRGGIIGGIGGKRGGGGESVVSGSGDRCNNKKSKHRYNKEVKIMKSYPKYKDSGVDWIGEIPEHWDCLRIKKLCKVRRGASPRPIDDPKYFDDQGKFAWVRIADVTASDKYLDTTTQTLSELGSSLSVKQYPGDIFVSIAGTVGKPIITKIKCCIHDGFVWFDNLKLDKQYFYSLLSLGELYKGLGKWGTQLNLNTETIGDIHIPLPPDSEIKFINYFLDRKTKLIDTLIEKKQKQIELLKKQRAAVINQAVTKGLNPDVLMKDSGVEWIGEIPVHWEVKKLKRYYRVSSGEFHKTENNTDDGYPIYGGNGLRGFSTKYNYEGKRLLIGRVGAKCGNVHLVEGKYWVSEHALIVYPKKNIDLQYFFYALWAIDFNKFAIQTAQPLVNSTIVTDRYWMIPPLPEQTQIAKFLDLKTKETDNQIDKINQQIDLLKEYRTTLISEAVTGKIDVRSESQMDADAADCTDTIINDQ